MRIVHLSDIHVWRYAFNPLRLMNKRVVGMVDLVTGRARKFRLERLRAVVERVLSLEPDHVLITGDLTTTAAARTSSRPRERSPTCSSTPDGVTVIPGNHDRYTTGSVRHRQFEEWFGRLRRRRLPIPGFVTLDSSETAVLGLDATRSHLSATGRLLPPEQLGERA